MSEETLGRYRLTRKLATGGMAEIWLASIEGPEGFQKRVVVKKILPHLAEDDEFVRMFLDEARIAARLNHPNIVQIFDLGDADGAYYIAMEYIPGKDLRRVYQDSVKAGTPLPIPLSVRVLIESAQALDYAHSATDPSGRPLRLVHRDVSPQNVIVTFQGGVKLVDFGIAKAADQAAHTRAGVLKGKYSYMSPEQAAGDPVDSRTDIFALGIVAYELATGFRLFKRDNEIATLEAVRECEVPAPSSISPLVPKSLDRVLLKALARDPDERYRTAGQLALALEEFLLLGQFPASGAHLAEFMRGLYPGGDEPEPEPAPAPAPSRERSSPSSSSRRVPIHPVGGTPRPAPGALAGRSSPGAPAGTRSARMVAAKRLPLSGKAGDDRPREPPPPIEAPRPVARPAPVQKSHDRPPEREAPEPMPSGGGETALEASEPADTDPGADEARRPFGRLLAGAASALVGLIVLIGLVVVGRSLLTSTGPRIAGALGATSGSSDGGCFFCGLRSSGEGRLTLVTTPPSVVFLGSDALGSTPLVEVTVPAGHVQLRLVNEAAALDAMLGVDIRPNQVTSLQKSFALGTVTVATPKGHSYQVFCQGKPLGRAPGPPLQMVQGDHVLTLVDDATGERLERTVTARPSRRAGR